MNRSVPLLLSLRPFRGAPSIWLLLLISFTTPVYASSGEEFALEHRVKIALEDAFAVLSCADIDPDLDTILPPDFYRALTTAVSAARSSGTVEDKMHMFVTDLGLDCSQLLTYTLIALVVDILNIIPYDHLIAEILAAATLLCYLGIL